MQTKALVGVLLFVLYRSTTDAANVALKGNVWKPLCELAAATRNGPSHGTAHFAAIENSVETYTKLKLKLLIYAAAKGSTTEASAARGLAAAADRHIRAAATTAKDKSRVILPAVAYGGEVAGAISSALKFLKHAVGNSKFCVGKADGTNADGNNEIDALGCGEANYDTSAPGDSYLEGDISADGFTKLTAVAAGNGHVGSNTCGVFKAITGNDGEAGGIKIATSNIKVHLAHGLIEGKVDDQPERAEFSNNFGQGKAHHTDYLGRTHAALINLKRLEMEKVPELTEETLKTLADDPAATATLNVEECARTSNKKITTTEPPKPPITEKYFGKDKSKIKELWNNLKKEEIEGTEDDTTKKVALETVNSIDKLQQALEFYTARAAYTIEKLKKEVDKLQAESDAKNKASTKVTETDETCEKKGTGAECKDGCKLTGVVDNKKCVVDPDFVKKEVEGVKAENDGKTTTNTTGSNSLLIKASPLFLAVLLF
uniref:Variable surface glycoprotein n=12 Tax=Trypanosoma evansi TaxID=5697 RepID=Q968M5_TRYEV|nr:variable surface glycoprotein [Trypanosoma evansi]